MHEGEIKYPRRRVVRGVMVFASYFFSTDDTYTASRVRKRS